jgi:hypothetical protein
LYTKCTENTDKKRKGSNAEVAERAEFEVSREVEIVSSGGGVNARSWKCFEA